MAITANAIQAQRLTATKLCAGSMRAGNAAFSVSDTSVFSFNAKLLALPAALTAMNATFTRASTATVNQGGTLITLSSGQFGTDQGTDGLYDYVAEPAATNLCLYSEDQTNAAWVKTNATISADAVAAPDGTTTADLITRGSTAAAQSAQVFVKAASAITYTQSFFVAKSVGNFVALRLNGSAVGNRADVVFNINTGVISTAAAITGTFTAPAALIVAIGGYYKISLTATSNTDIALTAAISFSSNGVVVDGTDSAANSAGYVWGAQLETGNRATSYIKTVAATATRAASVLSVPLANIPGFTSAQYTLFADCLPSAAPPANVALMSVDDGSSANITQVYYDVSSRFATRIDSASVAQANMFMGAGAVTTRTRVAASSALNSFLSAQQGVTGSSDLVCNMPVSPTTLRIGYAFGWVIFNGRIRRAGIITRALTQAQINGLTA